MQDVHIFWDVCLRLPSALACAQDGHSKMQSIGCDAGVHLPHGFHLEGILQWGCLMMQTKVEIRAALKAHSLLNLNKTPKYIGVSQEKNKEVPAFLVRRSYVLSNFRKMRLLFISVPECGFTAQILYSLISRGRHGTR